MTFPPVPDRVRVFLRTMNMGFRVTTVSAGSEACPPGLP